jgi:alpha-mannosidase
VSVPPLGWVAIRPATGSGHVDHEVQAGERELGNGLVSVSVAEDGTLILAGVEGIGRVVAGGDVGDSYNYAPPEDDQLIEQPDEVRVELVESGPVRGGLTVVRTYRWQGHPVDVATAVELRAGEPFCRIHISFENPCSDHRVRFHLPLAAPAESSAAEGQFAVVERGLEAEGGHGEAPLPTFPAYGFVDAGGLAVLLDHVMEYELVDEGRELALTLLRSTGLISRRDNRYRKVPAGPELEIPAAQLHGPWSIGFALFPHEGAWREAGVHHQVERYRHPFVTAPGTGPGGESKGSGPELPDVVLSSLRRVDGRLVARVVNESAEGTHGLRPWEIRSVELEG